MFLLNQAAYWLITAFFKTLGHMPRKLSNKLGNIIGSLWFIIDKKHRNIALENLTYAFGREKTPREIYHLAQQVFKHFVQMLFEIGWSLNLKEKDFKNYFRIEGLSHYQKAYAKNKGILLLTAHIGNWELLPIIAAMVAMPAAIVFRPLDFEPLNQFFINLRSRFGARMIPKGGGMRGILRNLHHGKCIALLMDQRVNWTKSLLVDFFGRRAYTHKSMALVALKTGVPVVPLFLIRDQAGFTARFGAEVPLHKTGDRTKDLKENTLQYNQIIENIVREYPDQWLWFHRRWRIKPQHSVPRQ